MYICTYLPLMYYVRGTMYIYLYRTRAHETDEKYKREKKIRKKIKEKRIEKIEGREKRIE